MKLLNIFERAIDFGTLRSRENVFSFTIKCFLYIIPAVILGNYNDVAIQKIKRDKRLGENGLYYILLQTLINILVLYIILHLLTSYTSEFQMTIAGGFFIVLYFGIQTNYIHMIKDFITPM